MMSEGKRYKNNIGIEYIKTLSTLSFFGKARPISASFLIRTSGKEYHSQAGSTRKGKKVLHWILSECIFFAGVMCVFGWWVCRRVCVFGYFWLFWLFLVIIGYFGYFWLFLVIFGYFEIRQKIT